MAEPLLLWLLHDVQSPAQEVHVVLAILPCVVLTCMKAAASLLSLSVTGASSRKLSWGSALIRRLRKCLQQGARQGAGTVGHGTQALLGGPQ
jgi:hypothetical protein